MSKEGAEAVISERPTGTFSRQLFLGETLDKEHIEATYDADLVAQVGLPKQDGIRPQQASAAAVPHAHTDCLRVAGRPVSAAA
ncbi:Hsp20 family protein [Streptomyces sp. ISL-100]|uniref:Hsp20 family protein n=1 Tax=Streptomyces sp. ISL-100 TaxID=2819173 RepID=UPI0020353C45|nr:Hsp20 family protein [Streptomyces sp. ISL-100]